MQDKLTISAPPDSNVRKILRMNPLLGDAIRRGLQAKSIDVERRCKYDEVAAHIPPIS
jgi:hypothetical protein